MSLTVLSTDEAPPRERKGYWGELVSRSFGRLQSDTYGDEDFRGRIAYSRFGDVHAGTLVATRHRVVRTAADRGCSDPGHLKLVVQRRGRCLFEQDGRRAWLRPGDWSLYDTTRSYIVSAPDSVDLQVLMLPRDAVLRGQAPLQALLVRRLRATGMSRVAFAAVDDALAAAALRPGPQGDGARIAELVHLALLEQCGARVEPLQRWQLRERIKAFIEEHLAEAELDADAIAAGLGCSKRSVHKAFELEGASLRQYIWDQRLARVRAELEDASLRQTIGDVAFAWGFSSAAHFSRAFRSLYGVSPRDWRNGNRPGLEG